MNSIGKASDEFCVLAFYQFVTPILAQDRVEQWREEIRDFLKDQNAKGLVLLSVEGLNGTICFSNEITNVVEGFLTRYFPRLQRRRSWSPNPVFHRLLVKIRPENVTLGKIVSENGDERYLRINETGAYVKPGPEWNELLNDTDCLVVDTRNTYEVEVGTFRNAVQPETQEFREFPDWIHQKLCTEPPPKKLAMFCTGGIRCEKSTAYVLDQMQKGKLPKIPVYHLQGGILAYLDTVPQDQSLFDGECFVFDKRTAVSHGLQPSQTFVSCHACRSPIHRNICQGNEFMEGVFCPNCFEQRQNARQRYVERQKQFDIGKHVVVSQDIASSTDTR